MRAAGTTVAMVFLCGGAFVLPDTAEARTGGGQARPAERREAAAHSAPAPRTAARHRAGFRQARAGGYGYGISCVPYARAVSGIEVRGNAHTWWNGAAGLYARGQRPEPGAVLNFRASGGMRHGHVAVVERLVSPREMLIDHSNWEGPGIRKGTPMSGVRVIDVSDRNDWSAVRVQVGHDDTSFGRVYPAYGFIYNRADTGSMLANAAPGRPAAGRWPAKAFPAEAPLAEVAEAGEPTGHAAQHALSVRYMHLPPAR